MTEADGDAVGEGAGVFAAPEGAAGVAVVETEDLVEDRVGHDDFEAIDGCADGVECADHASHAGAGDDVDGDVVLLEPLEDADLREGEGTAAAQGEADAGAANGTGGSDGWGEGVDIRASGGGLYVTLTGRELRFVLVLFAGGDGARCLCRGLRGGAIGGCGRSALLRAQRGAEQKHGGQPDPCARGAPNERSAGDHANDGM